MSTAVGRGRGRGRGLNKGWLGNFKPKPVPITVEEISSKNIFYTVHILIFFFHVN